MRVLIPSALQSYTRAAWVEAQGSTVDAVLWDLDRQYPGIRFRMIDEQGGIRRHIRFDSKVVSADFDSAAGYWVVTLEGKDGQRSRVTAGWLYLGSGYYDYDKPYEAHFDGREDFKGEIVHPQFWPENLDYTGKQVVVIGSGATAVTIVPSMADKAAHVTMLQRTPTWYVTRPDKVAAFLTKRLKSLLGDKYDEKAFTPPYNPWEQRLCLVPDADLFEAIKAGKASVVTDRIERFDATGIQLQSGKHLDADVIVTATGLKMVMAGKIAISVDGLPVDFADRYYYKGAMFSNVPNLAAVFGYLNASWTLRADINARYICDVLNAMKSRGMEVAVPKLAPNHHLDEDNIYDFSSGYIERARHLLPKSASDMRWRLNQDYVRDVTWMRDDPIEDGVLQFSHPRPATAHKAHMAAAE